jgi:hypothetical protein
MEGQKARHEADGLAARPLAATTIRSSRATGRSYAVADE